MDMRRWKRVLLPGILGLVVWSLAMTAAAEALLFASDAFIRAMPPGQAVTAAFMRIHNLSDRERRLVDVRAPFAERAEIHEHSHHQGMMRMRRIMDVRLPARAEQAFKPGGYHIMVFGVRGTLDPGQKLPLELVFADGETLSVMATVRSVLDE